MSERRPPSLRSPIALERRMLFFGAFTGANVLRNDPPDRYVFNYRASYVEETDAAVRYLVKMRKIQPKQIAVFAQQDSFGDAGFAGRRQGFPRARRQRRDDPAARLQAQYGRRRRRRRPAEGRKRTDQGHRDGPDLPGRAKFIEKTRDLFPGLTYTNVSFVGSTALADELMLLGPRYASGVIVTQVVPAVSGYSSIVLEYKNALTKYFPGEAPDYVSLEGYVAASVLIQAHQERRTALRHRKADRYARGHARARSRPRHQARLRPRRTSGLPQGLGHGDRRQRQVPGDRAGVIARQRCDLGQHLIEAIA